jgi:cytochrome P450
LVTSVGVAWASIPGPDGVIHACVPDREFGAKAQILSFGFGTHLCTGSQLAKLEMVESLDLLLDRFDEVRFADDVPDDRGYVLRSPADLRVVLS